MWLTILSLSSGSVLADDPSDNDTPDGGAIPCHVNPVSCFP